MDFTNQIIYGNRSFVEHPVLDILNYIHERS